MARRQLRKWRFKDEVQSPHEVHLNYWLKFYESQDQEKEAGEVLYLNGFRRFFKRQTPKVKTIVKWIRKELELK